MNLRLPPILIALIVLTVSGSQLGAHEFWLEPDEFSPKLDARTGVRIRIGEHFDGALYPYLTGTFFKFTTGQGESEQAVEGLDGDDDPAIGVAFRKKRSRSLLTIQNPITSRSSLGQSLPSISPKLGRKTSRSAIARWANQQRRSRSDTIAQRNCCWMWVGLDTAVTGLPACHWNWSPIATRMHWNRANVCRCCCCATAHRSPVFWSRRLRNPRQRWSSVCGPIRRAGAHRSECLGSLVDKRVHMTEPPAFARVDWVSIWASHVFRKVMSASVE